MSRLPLPSMKNTVDGPALVDAFHRLIGDAEIRQIVLVRAPGHTAKSVRKTRRAMALRDGRHDERGNDQARDKRVHRCCPEESTGMIMGRKRPAAPFGSLSAVACAPSPEYRMGTHHWYSSGRKE